MLSVQKEDSKFLLEVLSYFESRIDDVIPSPYLKMAEVPERRGLLRSVMGLFREALFDNRIGWIVRRMLTPREAELGNEEIVMRMSGDHPSTTTNIPDNFMEKFINLPQVPMAHMLRMLSYNDIFRLQMVAGPFAEPLEGIGRGGYALNNLVRAHVRLQGVETVRIIKNNESIDINHQQFGRTLQVTRIRTLLIVQEGTLRADSFHIPQLTCIKLDIRIIRPLDETEENELARVFELIAVNRHIAHLTLIARKTDDCAVLRDRLVQITSRGRYLVPEHTQISVIPP